MTTLVIFDIDGTLLNARWTNGRRPWDLFARCFAEHFGVPEIAHSPADYTHQTDTCWTDEAFRRQFARAPQRREVDGFWQYYSTKWLKLAPAETELSHITGAEHIFARLAQQGMRIALASGGLRRLQEFKLRQLCFQYDGLPAAYAEDGYSREDITRAAAGQVNGATRTVYVGDGWWDLSSCRSLGMPFIAIGKNHQELSQQGATHALPDYTNAEAFIEAVALCQAPGR